MKAFVWRTALTSIAILFLLGGTTAAFANSTSTWTTRPLSLSVPVGGVTNFGNQVYTVNGGQVAYAEIAGQTLNPGATIRYNFMATQTGMTTKGFASLRLTGTTVTNAGDVPVSVSGKFHINSNVPGAVVGQSEVPFFFLTSTSNVQVTVGGSTQTLPETLDIESPYFNPFGAPIVLVSPDGAIVIAATYTQGTILWMGSQVTGALVGSLGNGQASGTLSLTTHEIENLVEGTSADSGTVTFSGMTPSSLDASGSYTGNSIIPTTGGIDCTSITKIPGTCTETGFQSTGKFRADGISGKYTTTWPAPALEFSSTITATVTQPSSPNTVNGRLNSGGSLCTNNGGTWVGSPTYTCTIPSGTEWDIAAGNTLFIDSGVTLVNDGTIVNYGTVLNSGTTTNNGAITNDGVTFYNGNSGPTGTFTNNGVFTNDVGLTFNNFASFTNSAGGTVVNYGTYMNHTGGSTDNHGTFFNYGTTDTHVDTFDDYGSFANTDSGTVSNSSGATLTQECGGLMVNVPSSAYTQVAGCSR